MTGTRALAAGLLVALMAPLLTPQAADAQAPRHGIKTKTFTWIQVRDDDPWLVRNGYVTPPKVELCEDDEWLHENGLPIPSHGRGWDPGDTMCETAWTLGLWKFPAGHLYAGLNRYAPYDGMGSIWVQTNPPGVAGCAGPDPCRIPVGDPHFGIETSDTCAVGPPPVDIVQPVEQPQPLLCNPVYEELWGKCSCQMRHGAVNKHGLVRRWLRRFLPASAPSWDPKKILVRTVTDHCFASVPTDGSEERTGAACEAVPTTSTDSTGTVTFQEDVVTPSTRQIPDPAYVAPSPCSSPPDPLTDHANCGESVPTVDEDYLATQTLTHAYTDTDPNQGPCECPAGWSGAITQERDFEWHDRDYVIDRQNPDGTFTVEDVAGWWGHTDGTVAAGTQKLFYDEMKGELVSRHGWPSPKGASEPAAAGSGTMYDLLPSVYRVTLASDWHEETNTCRPPVPSGSGGGGGDSDSPYGWVSEWDADGTVYEHAAADGTSRFVSEEPEKSGSAPSYDTGIDNFSYG